MTTPYAPRAFTVVEVFIGLFVLGLVGMLLALAVALGVSTYAASTADDREPCVCMEPAVVEVTR